MKNTTRSPSKQSSWTCVPFRNLRHVSACYFSQSDRFHEQILQLETAVLTCKRLQSLQNNITHVLGGNISLPNKIPIVLPFEGFPPMTKQVTIFFCIKLYTLSFRGVTTVIIQRTRNDWIVQYEYVPWLTHQGNPPSKRRQSRTKYEPAIYMCKETAENGGLSNENRCVHVSLVNYDKPWDCNKIVRCKFNESFHF